MGVNYSINRHDDGLTEREREVLKMLAEKKSFRAMAKERGGTHQRYHEITKSLINKGVIAKAPDGTYSAVVPLERSAVYRRLQAESVQPPTTTQPEEPQND